MSFAAANGGLDGERRRVAATAERGQLSGEGRFLVVWVWVWHGVLGFAVWLVGSQLVRWRGDGRAAVALRWTD